MQRLTDKDRNGGYHLRIADLKDKPSIEAKLGPVEDAEEELGATAYVMLRALIDGAWFKKGRTAVFTKGVAIGSPNGTEIEVCGFFPELKEERWIAYKVNLYGIKWALTKEELTKRRTKKC